MFDSVMLRDILLAAITGAGAGIASGLVTWGAVKRDLEWLKEGLTELRGIVFANLRVSERK